MKGPFKLLFANVPSYPTYEFLDVFVMPMIYRNRRTSLVLGPRHVSFLDILQVNRVIRCVIQFWSIQFYLTCSKRIIFHTLQASNLLLPLSLITSVSSPSPLGPIIPSMMTLLIQMLSQTCLLVVDLCPLTHTQPLLYLFLHLTKHHQAIFIWYYSFRLVI